MIAGVLAIGLVASAVFLTHYQPLGFGSSRGHEGTTYRQGASFSYAVSLRNNGDLPITITGVDTGDGLSLLRTTGIYVLPGNSIATWGNNLTPNLNEPFQSFTLGPGQEQDLLVKNVFDGCRNYAPSTGEGFVALHVSFTILGFTRHTWVDFGNPMFSITSPDTCPGRP